MEKKKNYQLISSPLSLPKWNDGWRISNLPMPEGKKLDFKVRAILELKNYGGAIRKTWSVGRKGPKTYQVILKCLLK